MSAYLARGGQAALLSFALAQAAAADVTATEVWAHWRDGLTGTGYTVTGTEALSGGTLTVTDIELSMSTANPPSAMRMMMDRLVFTENGDGTVSVSLPDRVPMRTESIGSDGEAIAMEMAMTLAQPSLVVSGAPEDMLFTYGMAQAGVALESMSVDGELMPPQAMGLSLTAEAVSGSTSSKVGELREIAQTARAASVAYAFNFDDPESDDVARMTGRVSDMAFQGGATLPLEVDTENPQAMLDAGFGFAGTFTSGGGQSAIMANAEGEQFSSTSQSQGGRIEVAMDSEALKIDIRQSGTTLNIMTSELPFPVTLDSAVTAMKLALPLGESLTPQSYGFGLELSDFTMAEQLWTIFDPAAILPRDPATFLVELTGQATVLFDFLDPMNAGRMDDGAMPAEVNSLSIDALKLSVAGAELTGQGAFTLNNRDLQSFGGVPAPQGRMDLRLAGGNGLLDRLVQMGVLSEEDAGGARMMMGLFGVPGDGADVLNSTIEINDQGHVLANGQRIQ